MSKTRDLANLADLNFDSGTMVVDKVNDRVGVGNATPSATLDVDGTIKLDGNYPVGTGNVALGDAAMNGSISGSYNTALGDFSMQPMTSGASNTGVGGSALRYVTSGSYNTAIGHQALQTNTTANNNTAVGYQAGYNVTTGTANVAVGKQAAFGLTTGQKNVAVGGNNFYNATSASSNIVIGYNTLYSTTTGANNVAIGESALYSNTTASNNTAVGYQAGYSNTTGAANTFLGYRAGYNVQTSPSNTILGYRAGENNTSANGCNTFVGNYAGYSNTGGYNNTFVGARTGGLAAGYYVTTGSKNTIIGGYNGNQGGLDIRTSSNNIVLSDGDGNPRYVINNSAAHFITNESDFTNANNAILCVNHSTVTRGMNFHVTGTGGSDRITFQNDNGTVGTINTSGSSTSYGTSSDYRLKENVIGLTGAADRVQQLAPKRFNFIADADKTVDGFLAHEVADIVPEAINGTKDEVDDDGNPVYQGIDQSKLVPLLTAALQEALTKIDALETRIVALETN